LELDVAGRINRAIAPQGDVQVRDGLSVGESLVAAIVARACAPRSKRAFADWARNTYLPELMRFTSADLTSQHFWDQMNAVAVDKLADLEQELVRAVVRIEQLQLQALAYDTTNFFTHIASTNLRPKLPQRGHNKQGRHDLRQMGLALVVDQQTQLPLAHVLYAGARSDMRTFAEFLQPVRKRLRELTLQPEQLTLVFDAGSSSRQNLERVEHYVTSLRPSDHRALLQQAAEQLAPVQLSSSARWWSLSARNCRTGNCAACSRRWRGASVSWRNWACTRVGVRKQPSASWPGFAAGNTCVPCSAIAWIGTKTARCKSGCGATGKSIEIWPSAISDCAC
jgi:hypothetical protein